MFLWEDPTLVVCLSSVTGSRSGMSAEEHTVIEPVPEAVESILNKIFRRSKIEPGID